uniref:Uncharacterized protein n=1 Tax=Rhizophora mucronata TaxID=61149 RepID=A0A2P2PW58_RHIMU
MYDTSIIPLVQCPVQQAGMKTQPLMVLTACISNISSTILYGLHKITTKYRGLYG